MKQKGFTLIELLAVIVILAVIALIATPLIMNVINDAKKGAARDSGYSIVRAGELDAASTKKIPPIHYDENSDLELKGDKPSSFHLNFNSDMDAELRAWINGYCVVKNYNSSKITIDESKKTEAACVGSGGSSTNKKYANGEAIYFNPEFERKCTSSEAVSTTGTKSGCMKWYAFNDSESSDTVNVILDHNTTAIIEWDTSGNSDDGLDAILDQLKADTISWSPTTNPRLIEANEVAKITGNTGFDATTNGKDNWFFLQNNTQENPGLSQGKSKYPWLLDRTNSCYSGGCNVQDSSNYGYWTSSRYLPGNGVGWFIYSYGILQSQYASYSTKIGVRPVITISKTLLK